MEQSTDWESRVLTNKGRGKYLQTSKKKKNCNRLQKQKADKAGNTLKDPHRNSDIKTKDC